jgi:hypothetical protein
VLERQQQNCLTRMCGSCTTSLQRCRRHLSRFPAGCICPLCACLRMGVENPRLNILSTHEYSYSSQHWMLQTSKHMMMLGRDRRCSAVLVERRGEERHGLVAALHQVAACRVAEGQCVSRPDPGLDGSVPAKRCCLPRDLCQAPVRRYTTTSCLELFCSTELCRYSTV